MLLLDQIISDSEIFAFKQYFQNHFDKKYVNWQNGDDIIDHRLNIDKNSPEFKIINRIVKTNFSNPVDMWSAYQR